MEKINNEERTCHAESKEKQEASKVETVTVANEALGQKEGRSSTAKVLGLTWNMDKDTMEVQLSMVSTSDCCSPTKRKVLSILAAIFDPLGIISPVSVPGKVLLQEICARKIGTG